MGSGVIGSGGSSTDAYYSRASGNGMTMDMMMMDMASRTASTNPGASGATGPGPSGTAGTRTGSGIRIRWDSRDTGDADDNRCK